MHEPHRSYLDYLADLHMNHPGLIKGSEIGIRCDAQNIVVFPDSQQGKSVTMVDKKTTKENLNLIQREIQKYTDLLSRDGVRIHMKIFFDRHGNVSHFYIQLSCIFSDLQQYEERIRYISSRGIAKSKIEVLINNQSNHKKLAGTFNFLEFQLASEAERYVLGRNIVHLCELWVDEIKKAGPGIVWGIEVDKTTGLVEDIYRKATPAKFPNPLIGGIR